MAKKGKWTKNPCIVVDEFNRPHLNVFHNFYYEDSLPKYRKEVDKDYMQDKVPMDALESSSDYEREQKISTSIGGGKFRSRAEHTSSSWRYDQAMRECLLKERKNNTGFLAALRRVLQLDGVNVEKVFKEAKEKMHLCNTTEEIEHAKDAAEQLHQLLIKSGQISQAERLGDYINTLSGELVLVKNGITKYLLEEDVIDFMQKSEKGILIDFLRNYGEMLPLDVSQKKIAMDKMMVFDNYAILFYSPKVDPFRFVKDKYVEQKRRDPILFGMIEGSNKLYYICDWVWKDDDLTLEKLEDAIGRKAHNLQDANIAETQYTIDSLNQDIDKIRSIIKDN